MTREESRIDLRAWQDLNSTKAKQQENSISEVKTGVGSGLKSDQGKLDYSLLPFESIEEVVKVLMHGVEKYKRDNWKLVEDSENRYFSAAFRHLIAWKKGEKIDSESGLNHLAHAACCVLFMLYKDKI